MSFKIIYDKLKRGLSRLPPMPLVSNNKRGITMSPTSSSACTTAKLSELRKLMSERDLTAYYVPSEDAHQSEYISERDGRRAFVSNFTGSAGFAIVTINKAALWTDGRYFLQASQQLDQNWQLMKAGLPETPSKDKWLAAELVSGQRVGVDPALISFDAANKLRDNLAKSGIALVPVNENLIDAIWKDQPPFDPKEINHLPVKFSGKSSNEKISELRAHLKSQNNSAIIISALDEIAWLFNLRGEDIDFNPVFFSYALVTSCGKSFIFLSASCLSLEAEKSLKEDGISVESYLNVFERIGEICEEADLNLKGILVTSTCNWKLVESVGIDRVRFGGNPIETAKSVKNETEIRGFRQCHIRDGAALCRYFAWLEEQFALDPTVKIDEVDGADHLESFRSEGENFKGLSFDTISGSGPNGAIIHYHPEKETAALITTDQLYLCDSGAQYLDGTTDVTRTVHFGAPSDYERECFTRVLKGNLALERAVFPSGTSGLQLDVLARLPLWQVGLDFRHGTGHGVGHFLNVHEGPQSISFRPSSNEAKFVPGMTITNEPGYYEDGKFGIRIENVLIVKKADTRSNFGNVNFYNFENLTMCPIQSKLVDLSIMTAGEIDQLNVYHRQVWMNLSPLLRGKDDRALKWLEEQCQPIKL